VIYGKKLGVKSIKSYWQPNKKKGLKSADSEHHLVVIPELFDQGGMLDKDR